jgi:hypothetical protein
MEAVDLLCSRNAHAGFNCVLTNAGGARLGKGRVPARPGREGENVARSGRSISPHPPRDTKQAWREHHIWAVLPPRAQLGQHGCRSTGIGTSKLGRTIIVFVRRA